MSQTIDWENPAPRGSDEDFERKWEPIFRAAREGRLPNRAVEVLAMSDRLRRAGFKFDRYLNLEEAKHWLAERGQPGWSEPL